MQTLFPAELSYSALSLGETLSELGLRVAYAESLTAGLVCAACGSVPGASSWLDRGWVVYDVLAKVALGVSPQIIEKHGVVSSQCAENMALCALRRSGADVAVSLTGYAGPSAGPDAPAGTFFIGFASSFGSGASRFSVRGERDDVRLAAAMRALECSAEQARLFSKQRKRDRIS